jgi:signal transduction histidine kinase
MTTLSSLVQIAYEYKQESNQLDSNLQAIEKTGIESLKNLLWTVDHPGITRQIDSILLIPEVVKIKVFEENGSLIAERSKNEVVFKRIKHVEFKFSQENSVYFGKTDLYYTTDYLINHLQRRILTILITNFIKTSLASLVLMFLFSYYVVNPITTLANSFDPKIWQDLSQIKRAILKKRGKRDEIDLLCDGVNDAFGLIESATKLNNQRIADQQQEIVVQNTNTLKAIKKVDEAEEKLRAEQAANVEARRVAMIGVLAQGMAHEVNNPLMIIKGQVWRIEQMLYQAASNRDSGVSLDSQELKKRIVSSQQAISRISNIITSLKKLGSAGDSSETKVMSIHVLFNDIKNLMTAVCNLSDVSFLLDPGEAGDCLIKVKESEMVQVLVNLVNNSLEALESIHQPDKWIRLTAETSQEKGLSHIYLKVTDCGSGIPAEIAEKIFLPFFTTKPVGKGTGLGLSVVYQLVTGFGGKIYVNQKVHNTEIVIKLPKAA